MRTGRFLLATIDGGGTIPPEVGLARRLVERGHQVLVLADPTVEKEALAAGCTFTPWRTAPHFRTIEEQTALMWEVERRSGPRQFVLARDQIICGPAGRFADDVVTTVREHGVDVVLAEAAVAGILVGAEATGLPTAALMANIYLRPTPGLPQVGTGWSPARGPIGRLRDALAAMALHRLWATGLPTLNAARAAHGLSPVADMYEQLDHCARVLVMTSPSFDFPVPALPPNVRYVGPQLDDPNWAGRDYWRPVGDDPLVLVAMSSTFQSQVDPLLRVADGLGHLPVRAVLTTGPAVAPEEVPAPCQRAGGASRAAPAGASRSVGGGDPRRSRQRAQGSRRRRTPRLYAVGSRSEGQHGPRAPARRGGASEQEERPAGIAAAVHRVLDQPGLRTCGASVCRDPCR